MALYQKSNNKWTRHRIFPCWSCTQTFHSEEALVEEPPSTTNLQVALVVAQGTRLLLTWVSSWEAHPSTLQGGWKEKLTLSTFAQNWQLLFHVQGLEEWIVNVIGMSKVSAVSDGSFQHLCGMCAWIIKTLLPMTGSLGKWWLWGLQETIFHSRVKK